jgi:hypothetical protein
MEPTSYLIALGVAECALKTGTSPRALPSSLVYETIQNFTLAQLAMGDIHPGDREPRSKTIAGDIRAWIFMTPAERRRFVVAQTGRSWDQGNDAHDFARSLWVRFNGSLDDAMRSMSRDVEPGRARKPEEQAWWVVVEGALVELSTRKPPAVRAEA